MHYSLKPSAQEYLLDALCLAAPVALFYDSLGRVLVWALFIVALGSLRHQKLAINRRLVICITLYIVFLALISLGAVNPLSSLDAVSRIFMGFLVFLPGMYVGNRWQHVPPRIFSFAPILLLAAAHLTSPRIYREHLFFGFEQNPNIVGRGLTMAILALLIAACSLKQVNSAGGSFFRFRLHWIFYLATLIVFSAFLLLSNFRSGWLGLAVGVLFFVLTSPSLSSAKKLVLGMVTVLSLSLLVAIKDYKGFGYGALGERLDLWARSLASWQDHFLFFGSGFASFSKMSGLYYYGNVTKIFNYPHNIIVEILFSSGLFGLLATLAFVALLIHIFSTSQLDMRSMLSRSACASVLAMLIIGQLDMEFASFHYIASISFFCGILYAQRVGSIQSVHA